MKRKILQTVLCFTLAAILLCGCGNEKNESATEDVQESATEEEVTEEPEKEEEKEAQQPDEEEISAEEETKVLKEEGDEVTYITDYISISDFMSKLDPEYPAIVIYNDEEGYIINIEDGQYYKLKKQDRIYLNLIGSSVGKYGYNIDIAYGDTNDNIDEKLGVEILPDYSKFNQNQEFWFKMKKDNGEILQITCYFDVPTE